MTMGHTIDRDEPSSCDENKKTIFWIEQWISKDSFDNSDEGM